MADRECFLGIRGRRAYQQEHSQHLTQSGRLKSKAPTRFVRIPKCTAVLEKKSTIPVYYVWSVTLTEKSADKLRKNKELGKKNVGLEGDNQK